jgi:exodeoxyribonuclease VII large subunit
MNTRPKSVTEITHLIKSLIDDDPQLGSVWIEGEISNYTRASSGHCYFSLKDSAAVLRCVMWRNVSARLNWIPEQGDLVEAWGSVSVYERGGAYQLYVDELQRAGIGFRWREFLELKARLEAEGLFAGERKRPLPDWPKRIGVVTSPTGAAIRDILNVLADRYPLVEVVVSPSLVQGPEAPGQIVQAIEALNRLPDIDVVIVARGGGSAEDLWAFNDEAVARAIGSSTAPIVTGVGHETDFTIADFVADLRTPTPSTAAAAVVPDVTDLQVRLIESVQALTDLIAGRLGQAQESLRELEQRLDRSYPMREIAQYRQHLDDVMYRLQMGIRRQIENCRAKVAIHEARLMALHPLRVLNRGYAVVQDSVSGARLTQAKQASVGQRLSVHMRGGRIDTQVESVVATPDKAS